MMKKHLISDVEFIFTRQDTLIVFLDRVDHDECAKKEIFRSIDSIYLEPVRILRALLSSKNLDEALVLVTTHVARISSRKVAVQRCRVELGKDVDLGNVAVQAVANRNVDQPVVCSKRNRRLCPLLGKWVEPCPSSTSQYDPKNTLHKVKKHTKGKAGIKVEGLQV